MKYHYTILTILLFSIFSDQNLFAINELIVRVPDIYGYNPGYIDQSVLVIEPHGGYSEQSLYLKYSDHFAYPQGSKVEIIHRFELPQGSVVNDLWLWIGDSVMKAIMLDTWKARSIYDSIVSMKRDPAFLTKKGNQYELHIYPLEPGSFREIKINFITPTRWSGNNASVELPLKMLAVSNNTKKPLDILFRVRQNIWGNPRIREFPQLEFPDVTDTVGYHYKKGHLNDISTLESLSLTYNVNFTGGAYFNSNISFDNLKYFQLALSLKDIFNLKADSSSKKNLIGMDLSGSSNKNYDVLIPNVKNVLKSALKDNDFFSLIISGTGRTQKVSNAWIPASSANIDNILNEFLQSNFADSVAYDRRPNLLFCDQNASLCWGFTGLNLLVNKNVYSNVVDASGYFSQADIIASYDQGFEQPPTEFELPNIYASLDSFFLKGGRFLTYFDYNRDGKERVASHYIQGLATKSREHSSLTLFRNLNGNIGSSFPESIDHSGTYFLNYNDPTVKIELMDKNGNPAVISKKIGNGLIVVSGIWSFNDDAPLRKILGVPLLGLNKSQNFSQLAQLLESVKNEYRENSFDKALIFSNSDSLILKEPAENWVSSYLNSYSTEKPIFNSVNLLDGSQNEFPSISVLNIDYYGSGYLLKALSDASFGSHFETHTSDWSLISSLVSAYSIPKAQQFEIKAFNDETQNRVLELREIKQQPVDDNSPKFFIGSSNTADKLTFNINVKFAGSDSMKSKSFIFPIAHDTTNEGTIISSMLGYEELKELFIDSKYDTSRIVQLALKYNLLCDYTSLIALEPNDTIHFLNDPLDEGEIPTDVATSEDKSDSLEFSVYPNPFNLQTKIVVKTTKPSRINIYIYNILGQLISRLSENEELNGKKTYTWNGKTNYNNPVSSGVYLLRIEMKESQSNKEYMYTKKIMLLK